MTTTYADLAHRDTAASALGAVATCECMMCDHPRDGSHETASWRLVWEFALDDEGALPGDVVAGSGTTAEDAMLLCEHCCAEWLGDPSAFGGEPLRATPL